VAEREYQRLGIQAMFLPWAANTAVFQPMLGPKKYDVSFVGQQHGLRGRLIARLRAEGINVYARGGGWPEGRATWPEMAEIFSSSRVNLSFTESSVGPFQRRGWNFRGSYRADRFLLTVAPPPVQMKARPFEITACGAMAINGPFDELDECFEPGVEIAVADGAKQLSRTIIHYLENDAEREAIAAAGLARTLAEHTYQHRFEQLFDRIQLDRRQ
jgi:spore maturation protein CgeB